MFMADVLWVVAMAHSMNRERKMNRMNDDTISRQAAIANAISGRTREIDGEKWIRVSEVRESIKTLPPAERHGRWIPITERLPEEDYETGNGVQFSADVLATIVNHANDGELYVWLLKTVDGKWYDYTPNEYGTHKIPYWCEVIAWMPLPTPYKGGEEE